MSEKTDEEISADFLRIAWKKFGLIELLLTTNAGTRLGWGCMKLILLAAMMITPATAWAHEVRPCHERSIGIETLVTPVANNVQSFYNNLVQIYNIDTIEPAAASAGIAIVLPDNDNPLGGSKCLTITNFAAIDIKTSRATYDPAKGLSISIPTRSPDFQNGRSKPGPALNIVINLQPSSVSIKN